MKLRLLTALALAAGVAHADKSVLVQDAVWANDTIYDTIITDTKFVNPPQESTDTLYDFSMSGLMGQRSVSDAAPGMPGYNGGRWNVKKVVFTEQGLAIHDAGGDGTADFELTNAQAVEKHAAFGHLVILDTDTFLSCPLIP